MARKAAFKTIKIYGASLWISLLVTSVLPLWFIQGSLDVCEQVFSVCLHVWSSVLPALCFPTTSSRYHSFVWVHVGQGKRFHSDTHDTDKYLQTLNYFCFAECYYLLKNVNAITLLYSKRLLNKSKGLCHQGFYMFGHLWYNWHEHN